MNRQRILRALGAVVIVVGLDRLTKIWAVRELRTAPVRSYLNDTFRLLYAENEGAFLSLGSSLSDEIRYWVLAILPILVLGYLVYHLLRAPDINRWQVLAIGLILGGGGSNIFDRLLAGSVVDFMNLGIGSLRTGIFNVADVAIMIGLGLMLPFTFRKA